MIMSTLLNLSLCRCSVLMLTEQQHLDQLLTPLHPFTWFLRSLHFPIAPIVSPHLANSLKSSVLFSAAVTLIPMKISSTPWRWIPFRYTIYMLTASKHASPSQTKLLLMHDTAHKLDLHSVFLLFKLFKKHHPIVLQRLLMPLCKW